MNHFQDSFWGGNGYDEMHKFVKQGEEFCKEMEAIVAERSDVEKEYVKGLHKLVIKAKKTGKKCVGSVQNAWQKMVVELEAEEEIHRSLSFGLTQDCAKQLNGYTEQQIKMRHAVEASVKERLKVFADKQKHQIRMKKTSHKTCRDLESSLETLADVKAGRGKPMSEKDVAKLEKTCRKLEESLVKCDREYKESNMRTEEARLAWENAMYRCCQTLESLELERCTQVQNMLVKYSQLVETIIRPTEQTCEDLIQASSDISAEEDVTLVCSQTGTGPNQPEQMLVDFYEEDMKNQMNADRRLAYLEKKIQESEEEIARQEKAKQGVESLQKVYQEQPDFTDDKGAVDVIRQLFEADATLNLLKATHYKLLLAHSEISGSSRPSSEFAEYVVTTRDKQGVPSSVLQVPLDQTAILTAHPLPSFTPSDPAALYTKPMKRNSKKAASSFNPPTESPPPYPAEDEDGWGANEFEGSDDEGAGPNATGTLQFQSDNSTNGKYIGRCEALYDYTAQQSDELSFQPGDVINLIDRQDADWWHGEIHGRVGIFPAMYVQEM